MNSVLHVHLQTSPSQSGRLAELQQAFAQVCNALAPLAQQTACWNRVALHHMAYKRLRQQFPGLGSQMVCNAIYSVSRACRVVYQHPNSPFNPQRLAGKPLPTLQFLPQAPVYFDLHTLSLKGGVVSMFTLDGRMRFRLALSAEDETRFRNDKLREIALTSKAGQFSLSFIFAENDALDGAGGASSVNSAHSADSPGVSRHTAPAQPGAELPEYVLVIEDTSHVLPGLLAQPQLRPATP